jgi:hypothetical protein
MADQAPAVTDVAIPTPPPRDGNDPDELLRFLWQFSRAGIFNATLARQDRAIMLALFGKTLTETAITANAAVIANPPTQAQMVQVQGTVNALVAQVNALTVILGALVDAINANLKSLPATTAGQ